MDVTDWLRKLGLEQYAAAFRENAVTADILPDLTADDLKEIGVAAVGDRRRLLQAAAAERSDDEGPRDERGRGRQSASVAERRQLCVMFCDLVGSTERSSRLDPEDLSKVIRAYQARVRETIGRFGGFVARYVGDGVLIYFGWPAAHETDAERAVRAALAAVSAVSDARVEDEKLETRIGIATGVVVVGEPIGAGDARQQTAIGETPNRAARLQGLAAPNGVVIDATTRRQVGALFECQDLGSVELKGLPRPVQAWRVLRESAVENRFEALRATGLAPLIGRTEELELLVRRCQRARTGEGQVVLLAGEAGIGKSRLTTALRGQIREEPHHWISWFCSPHHQDSALHPIIAQLQRAAGFQRTDKDEARWAKLEALLASTALAAEDVPLLGDLLSLSGRNFPDLAEMSPEQRRRRAINALFGHFTGLARQRPIVAVFEDIHWADPSSRDLLDRLVGEIMGQAVLLVLTFRPEFQAPWAGLAHVTSLFLNRLDRRESAALVREMASPDRPLPADLVDEIVAKTDGVPLFVEELTRAALDAGATPSVVPEVVATGPPASPAVPASLHASLMARLDRLGADARDVAQIGAVIGREFEYELLAAVAGRGETGLQGELDRLTEAGLVSRRGTPPAANFLFKHALVQDVAYGTLLRVRRQELHGAIARALVEQFPEQRESQPELVAHHFTEAGQTEEAVGFWLQAGRRSAERSAYREGVHQLRRGLDLLMTLPESSERDRSELAFQLALGTSLQSLRGLAAPEITAHYERASTLCGRVGDLEGLIVTLNGLRAHMMIAGNVRDSLRVAKQCLATAERYTARDYRVIGHFGLGVARMYRGEWLKARCELERTVAHYDPARDGALAARFLVDPRATALGFMSLVWWAVGYPEQAKGTRDAAFRCEREAKHVHSSALIHVYAGAQLAELLRDVITAQNHANAVIALADQHGLHSWRAHAIVLLGWALGQTGRVADGISLVQEGLASFDAVGAIGHRLQHVRILAELRSMLGDYPASLGLIEVAHRQMEQTEHYFWCAEFYRIEGEIRRRAGAPDAQVESCFANAVDWAGRQQAKSFGLRAATSLARLWRDRGRDDEARDLLTPIYEWFTEGFDTADLKDARRLLDELRDQ
ncbi:MAG TPA: adenylate/guanylate cyclase domain-containing protein [Acetobacteraceae bacterium]